ncbi:MAG: class I SAM-dependent methyltransferase [Desulfobacteraceae bacterium]|nr:class I SAM-dependent methyltransferase [Desulfobacteraceae bacterium]
MKIIDSITAHDMEADLYDQQSSDINWSGPEIIFGLSFNYVKSNEDLFDLGIGTGLSSQPFNKTGLNIYGLDGSKNMLNICESKNIAVDLKQFDIQSSPYPYSDKSFNHAISVGVFNFFCDLKVMFQEISRVMIKNGIFGFTIRDNVSSQNSNPTNIKGVFTEPTNEGIPEFMHDDEYIENLLQYCGFDKIKEVKFMVWYTSEQREVPFLAVLGQKL